MEAAGMKKAAQHWKTDSMVEAMDWWWAVVDSRKQQQKAMDWWWAVVDI